MPNPQASNISLPSPLNWSIHADIAGRPVIWGFLTINSISGRKVSGTINFRGKPQPIEGNWNEGNLQITFNSPYAFFTGNLSIFDDAPISIRHFLLSGRLVMNQPSPLAGESGTWVASADVNTKLYPEAGKKLLAQSSKTLPPVGVFLTSDLRYRLAQQSSRI
ncbi:hypothetical protein [Bacillus sp. MUM 13]|uniref:hypothetical protein n=1 Tax=Bacillus sp. MUM 13 TaxID=1678001 RepID=UPI0008F59F70|nr:hypothetical protein [Bacillus sp. MUM 13]OIK14718.1 hypothetical protein BIV59_01900 [Bacillus sp. MUM 13]